MNKFFKNVSALFNYLSTEYTNSGRNPYKKRNQRKHIFPDYMLIIAYFTCYVKFLTFIAVYLLFTSIFFHIRARIIYNVRNHPPFHTKAYTNHNTSCPFMHQRTTMYLFTPYLIFPCMDFGLSGYPFA